MPLVPTHRAAGPALAVLLLLATSAACRNGEADVRHTQEASLIPSLGEPAPKPPEAPGAVVQAPPAAIAAAAARADSDSVARARADSARRDTLADSTRPKPAPKPATRTIRYDPEEWAALRPEAAPGSIFPEYRIVAYYGNPLSRRMGILGQLPPDEMMARLEQTAQAWAEADPLTPVKPALHLIATVAQGKPQPDNTYRLRMSDSVIERVAAWADQKGWLLFLDIQPGHSTVQRELPRLLKYLERPSVHLALDPEFAMTGRGDGALPGRKIGTLDAADINWAIDTVAALVSARQLPPKVLVVHRFTERMITNARKIKRDPRVQVVIDMDGFGAPSLKRSTWRYTILREPVQYTGIKLFYNPKNDKPLLRPAEVLEMFQPAPHYIQYQ